MTTVRRGHDRGPPRPAPSPADLERRTEAHAAGVAEAGIEPTDFSAAPLNEQPHVPPAAVVEVEPHHDSSLRQQLGPQVRLGP